VSLDLQTDEDGRAEPRPQPADLRAVFNGAAAMAGQLTHAVPGSRGRGPVFWLLAAITAAGLVLITLSALRIVGTAALVAVPTTLFLAVYLGAMAAAGRVLRGPVRLAALTAALAVIVMLGFCGWALAVPVVVALVSAGLAGPWRVRRCRAATARTHAHAGPGRPGTAPHPVLGSAVAARPGGCA
jgi:hypothetical protein